jgi:hypothetical protein
MWHKRFINPQLTMHTQAMNQQVRINPTFNHNQELARSKLVTEQERGLHSRQGVEAGRVFGRIKQDWSFHRFNFREM